MSPRRWLLIALAATLLAGAYVPTAEADHCRTKLTVFGRSSLAPVPSAPYSSSTSATCPLLSRQGVDDHLLPPQVDQVTARVTGDFGGSVQKILIELDGLGFSGHTFYAYRTTSALGGSYYQFPEWVATPSGPASGELTITAYYPGVTVSETYRTADA